jgi:hypothetical protein
MNAWIATRSAPADKACRQSRQAMELAYFLGFLGRFSQLAKMKTQKTPYMIMRMCLISMVYLCVVMKG